MRAWRCRRGCVSCHDGGHQPLPACLRTRRGASGVRQL